RRAIAHLPCAARPQPGVATGTARRPGKRALCRHRPERHYRLGLRRPERPGRRHRTDACCDAYAVAARSWLCRRLVEAGPFRLRHAMVVMSALSTPAACLPGVRDTPLA